MIRSLIGLVLGLGLGALIAGTLGAALGAVCGLALGILWTNTGEAAPGVTTEDDPVREEIKVLCVPKGQVADAVFVRDQRTGRWLDVESCSLCHPPTLVGCAKRCLILMKDYRPQHQGKRTRTTASV